MKISCPSCSAKYSVADEKIQDRLAKIRCRKCSATIVIDGTSDPANVYLSDANPQSEDPAPPNEEASGQEQQGPAPNEYAVDIADNDQRNMTLDQLIAAYHEGVVTGDTYIWKEGMADWQTLAEVPEVAAALHSSPAAEPSVPAAAVAAPLGGASTDLFGGIEQAGGENEITTSAPEPAPPEPTTAGTGARNESSVLFSLSALTAAQEQGGADAARSKSSDDSGLIDLQALTAAESAGPASVGGLGGSSPMGLGASPLISAPLGGVSGPSLGPASGRERSSGLGKALILLVPMLLVLGLAGAFFITRGGGSEAPTATAEVARQAAPAAVAQQPVATPKPEEPKPSEPEEPAAVKPSSLDVAPPDEAETASTKRASAEVAAPAKPKTVTRSRPRAKPKRRRRTTTKTKKRAPKPAATQAPAPKKRTVTKRKPKKKPAKKKPACNCAPADLMCAMRCSARK